MRKLLKSSQNDACTITSLCLESFGTSSTLTFHFLYSSGTRTSFVLKKYPRTGSTHPTAIEQLGWAWFLEVLLEVLLKKGVSVKEPTNHLRSESVPVCLRDAPLHEFVDVISHQEAQFAVPILIREHLGAGLFLSRTHRSARHTSAVCGRTLAWW